MPTTKIMVIRHAEKPNGDGGPGLMQDGSQSPEALTALVGLFVPANGASPRPPLEKPNSFFASGSNSQRPKETITPLAAALNLSITTFLKGQETQLVTAAEGPFSSPGSTKRFRKSPPLSAAARTESRPNGPAIASTSSGCSISRVMGLGVSPRRRSFCCRATPLSRSAPPASARIPQFACAVQTVDG